MTAGQKNFLLKEKKFHVRIPCENEILSESILISAEKP